MALFGKKKKQEKSKEPILYCPRDKSAMMKKARQGVTIDKCPKCGGIWLDGGEMEKIVLRLEKEQQKMAKKKK